MNNQNDDRLNWTPTSIFWISWKSDWKQEWRRASGPSLRIYEEIAMKSIHSIMKGGRSGLNFSFKLSNVSILVWIKREMNPPPPPHSPLCPNQGRIHSKIKTKTRHFYKFSSFTKIVVYYILFTRLNKRKNLGASDWIQNLYNFSDKIWQTP